ncbi:LysM peptidoglycan-binding domain-containing protein [Desulfocicer niacini]
MIKKNISLALTLVVMGGSLYLSGCVHTPNTTSTASVDPVSAHPGLKPSALHKRFLKNISNDENETAPVLEEEHQEISLMGTSEIKADSPTCRAVQEGIDHALELCESAQNFWEAGELESALNELDIAYATILDLDIEEQAELNQQKDDVRYMIAKRILEIHASRHIVVNGAHKAIPLTLNDHVKKEITRLSGPEKQFFIRSLRRAGRYRPYIVSEFKKAGLPEELSWLPLIESGFNVVALSPARALGLWQFIPSTGYKFGLKRNYFIDERLDPEKSTRAAIAYLSELHNIFGDWATVLAAYNCGEGRVLRTIRKQKTNYLDNFWDLYEKLPRETARYVPRFLATLHIINDLEKYDIDPGEIENPIPYEVFSVKKQVRLKDIAAAMDIPFERLKHLNPELRYALLPDETYDLRIPLTNADQFLVKFNTIKQSRTSAGPEKYVYHRIKRGETLSCIAKNYGTSIKILAKSNKISTRAVLKIGHVLKIPAGSVSTISRVAGKSPKSTRKTIHYTVKSGDNLWIIANTYGTTTKNIQMANHLRSTKLHIGQKLTIPGVTVTARNKKKKTAAYRVQSGDNPFTIAQKYNMTLQRLLSLNHLTSKSRIYPGQKLLVE